MKYKLIGSSAFNRKAIKLLKADPGLQDSFRNVLNLLSEDPTNPKLRTHKLKGDLKGNWSCSLTYSLRIIFKIIDDYEVNGEIIPTIYLEAIGNHDEVY